MAKRKSQAKRRVERATKKVSELARSGKAQVNFTGLSTRSLERIVQDAQGSSSQRDRAVARKAAAELARRSSK